MVIASKSYVVDDDLKHAHFKSSNSTEGMPPFDREAGSIAHIEQRSEEEEQRIAESRAAYRNAQRLREFTDLIESFLWQNNLNHVE